MKYILLYLVLASDELPDLKPPTMKCKPKQQQQVSSSDDDDDDDDIYSSKRQKGNNDEMFCIFIFLSIIIHDFTQFS